MTYAMLYWVLMLLALVFGFWNTGLTMSRPAGVWLLTWLLFLLLGLRVFGAAVHG